MKDKKQVKKLFFIGAVLIIILGTLAHFFYQWSGKNLLVGIFTPINESIWEHLKLSFFPILIFALVEYFYLRKKVKNFALALAIEEIIPIIFILAFYYTYIRFTSENLGLDILSFILGIILAKYFGYLIITRGYSFKESRSIAVLFLLFLSVFFLYATFSPPRLSLFEDPVTKTYGINVK